MKWKSLLQEERTQWSQMLRISLYFPFARSIFLISFATIRVKFYLRYKKFCTFILYVKRINLKNSNKSFLVVLPLFSGINQNINWNVLCLQDLIIQRHHSSDSLLFLILWLIKNHKHQLQNRMPWLRITQLQCLHLVHPCFYIFFFLFKFMVCFLELKLAEQKRRANKVETWYVKFSSKVNNKWKWNVARKSLVLSVQFWGKRIT